MTETVRETKHDDLWEKQRARLVDQLIQRGYLHEPAVIEAMSKVPREVFVPAAERDHAYDDRPVWIGWGQTVSAPHMVAIMSENLLLQPGQRVLEIGAGSGYHAAVTASLVRPGGHVTSVEFVEALGQTAREQLAEADADNVDVRVGDGGTGAPDRAPFDRIYLTCSAPSFPAPLLDQLAPGGVILAPIGEDPSRLVRRTRTVAGWKEEDLGACAFVPLRGQFGLY